MMEATIGVQPAAIATAISTWTKNRNNATTVIGYINQGNCFAIKKDEYRNWLTKSPQYIHAYPAVFDGKLRFVLIDDVTDSNPKINYDYVYVKEYTYGAIVSTGNDIPGEGNITIQEGLERVFRWTMNKNVWIYNKVASEFGVFQAFHIPFSDLDNLFQKTTGDVLYTLIGLSSDTQGNFADMILWNNVDTFSDPAELEDVALPIPPYSAQCPATSFQLLIQS